MKIKDLLEDFKIIEGALSTNEEVDFCTSCAEKSTNNSLLFVLPSVRGDTYENKDKFISAKPLAIIAEKSEYFTGSNIPVIEVKNARKAYSEAKSRIEKIDYSRLKFIGVTGTNGKTTTATLIYKILMKAGKKCAFIGTGKIMYCDDILSDSRYSMTSPDPDVLYPLIKGLEKRGCEIIVMEVSSHALKLSKVSPINFNIAIFTGLSEEHLDFHKNMDDYFKSKEILINNAERVIINCDDEYGRQLYKKYSYKSFGVSIKYRYDSYAFDIKYLSIRHTCFDYIRNDMKTHIKTTLAGEYNIINTMLAFEAATLINVSAAAIKEAISTVEIIEGRCECVFSDIVVIIDYAHTPLALENILKTAKRTLKPEQKLYLVFGCGGERDASKRSVMASVAEKYADFITVTEDNSRGEETEKILSDICSGFSLSKHTVIPKREAAIEKTITAAKAGDCVIIAGKGHEKYIIDNNGYRDFDERKIINEALTKRGGKR